MRRYLTVFSALAALVSCAVGPDFKRPAPPADADYGAAPVQGELVASEGTGDNAQRFVLGGDIPGDWWTLFRSPRLSSLVKQALKDNPDAAAAQAALRQANELYAAQRATLFPSLQGSFSAQRARNAVGTLANPTNLPQANPYYNLFTAQLSVSYLPDVFGGTRRALEQANAHTAATRFQLEATYLTLSSNVVVTAVQEASLRAQLVATERLLAVQRELTQTVQSQRGLGTASQLDLLAQQGAEAQTAATLPALSKQLAQTRDALTALLGQLPAQEPSAQFRLEDLTLPEQLPVSVPSKLIEQRPDVRQAEANLHAASAQVGIAISDMLPQFGISAQTGSAALQISQLFTTYTSFWGAGASLTQTLFGAGALLHRKRAAEAALDQAGAQYRAAVILACQNVADTLHALKADADTLTAAAEVERTAHGAFDIARQQRTLGTISTVALLNAEQTYEQAALAVVQARADRYADTAALYQALGGGWWNRPEGGSR